MKPGPKKKYEANLRIRVSAKALEILRLKAEEMGITLSEFLRQALGALEPREENDESDPR